MKQLQLQTASRFKTFSSEGAWHCKLLVNVRQPNQSSSSGDPASPDNPGSPGSPGNPGSVGAQSIAGNPTKSLQSTQASRWPRQPERNALKSIHAFWCCLPHAESRRCKNSGFGVSRCCFIACLGTSRCRIDAQADADLMRNSNNTTER